MLRVPCSTSIFTRHSQPVNRSGSRRAVPTAALSGGESPEQILGLPDGELDAQKIKAAYRSKLKAVHPDVYRGDDSEELTRSVIAAYEELSGGGSRRLPRCVEMLLSTNARR